MLLYAVSRYVIEFYRGDPRGVDPGVVDVTVHFSPDRPSQRRHAGLASSSSVGSVARERAETRRLIPGVPSCRERAVRSVKHD